MLVWPGPDRFLGFAANGVASVTLLDTTGSTLATAQVSDNLLVGDDKPATASAVEAFDAQGNVISTQQLPG